MLKRLNIKIKFAPFYQPIGGRQKNNSDQSEAVLQLFLFQL